MLAIGKHHILTIIGETTMSYLLDDGADGLLIAKQYAPANLKVGDPLKVFLYLDADQKLTATTLTPKGEVGDYVALKVREVGKHGSFLDMGLKKDLFLPIGEQLFDTEVADLIVVKIFLDTISNRLAATEKFDNDFSNEVLTVKELEVVSLMMLRKTDLGYVCIINKKHIGLLHYNEVFRNISTGEIFTGFIKKIKADDENKIDLMIGQPGYKRTLDESEQILEKLGQSNGFLPYHDKSNADDIYAYFGMSKKTFKMTIGMLYKKKKIRIESDGIYSIV